ncbi:MAG: prolyl oligopeptidase family serine peptidase [Gammaproteobacteria bacterium]|nr:prolyl oligopeptidase family serine peptidase [Gammaproteobacteria bacterium]
MTSTSPLPRPQEHPYGRWPSSLAIESLFVGTETISWLRSSAHGVFFLLSLPEEGNAQVLMFLAGRQSGQGVGQQNSAALRVSPPGFNLRSQVHEYGGISYAFSTDAVFFCNFSDQRLYRMAFDQQSMACGTPEAMTPATPETPRALRYADLLVDSSRSRIVCVREDNRDPAAEPSNTLVAIPFHESGEHQRENEGDILFADSDFVASPCLSPDGSLLAFQTWSHPYMPWDITQIRVGELDEHGRLKALRQVCPDRPGALVQPSFGPGGELYFIADWSDWWNLYRVSADVQGTLGAATAVLPVAAEMCAPQWQLGQHSYDFDGQDCILLALNRDCQWELARLDMHTQHLSILQSGLGLLENVFCQDGKALFYAASALQTGAIRVIDLRAAKPEAQTLFTGRAGAELSTSEIALAQHFRYSARQGTAAYGLYYPPLNPSCRGPEGSLPPLLVSVHGGPTGSAKTAFNPAIQFWTSRGFAWLDVNHRGSAGYGRRFRQSLYGEWGVADIEDVLGAVQHLVANGLADPCRVAIRGGSAGGYVVMAALASSDLFCAGVSYYGICDLERLARETHKFESRYLDQLIGPYPAMAATYRERSPIHKIDNIHAPILLLQGQLDKIVPPNQAEEIYQEISKRNPQSRYVCFADEGHGFRRPENQMAALRAELAFYEDCLLSATICRTFPP